MIRATWKSLLARKVRLLMSTFAIALGVAFVVGSLVFSAALSDGFNRLFGSSVGDVVVRPHGSATLNGDPSTRTVPESLVTKLAQVPGAARADGNVQAIGVFVVGKDHKVVGGLGAPTYGISYSDAPAGHGIPGLTLLDGHPPHGPHQIVLDEKTAEEGGYFIGEKVPDRDGHPQGRADRAAGRPRRVRRQHLAGRRDADDLRRTDRAEAVPARQGRVHQHLGDGRRRASPRRRCATTSHRCSRRTSGPSPATTPRTRTRARC